MAITVSLDDHLTRLEDSAKDLVADGVEAGLDSAVPTCPDWTVADLLGHQGMVHRWATAIVAGALPSVDLPPELDAATTPPADTDTLVDWFTTGAADLLDALRRAPDDLAAAVFLHASPAPRRFWARRQAHETTIHRVDALGAKLGRFPTTAEVGIGPELAVDGIDELVVGFINRRSSRLRSDEPVSVLIAPSDADTAWTVRISADTPVTTVGADPDHPADAVLTGTAAALYLGLWNRGDDIAMTGDVDVLGLWRDKVRVTWS
jgi:uncharacterized protein (TIGR03083 family)